MSAHVALPSVAESTLPLTHSWRRIPAVALATGVAALGAAYVLAGEHHEQFFFSYLVAWLFSLSLCLGALFFVLVQHAARAGWSVLVRRTAENLAAGLPALALLFIPIYLGRHELYHHWMDAETAATDTILRGKAAYLNETFFTIRAVFYLLFWSLVGWWFRKASVAQDTMGDLAAREEHSRRMERRSFLAIMGFAITITFAAIDWIMTLDPHWYSTMWGVYYFAGSFMAALALMSVLHMLMQRSGLLGRVITSEHYHDLGKLTFAFTVFWTYIAFSQYFLIWYGNIPEETTFYAHRMGNSWETMGIALIVGHFVVPYFFLMPRTIKRTRATLMIGSLWMLFMHFIDLHYLVMPAHHPDGVQLGPVDLLTWAGIFLVLMGAFVLQSGRAALIPMKDPRLAESVSFVNV